MLMKYVCFDVGSFHFCVFFLMLLLMTLFIHNNFNYQLFAISIKIFINVKCIQFVE